MKNIMCRTKEHYTIECTGDVCVGDVLYFEEKVYAGSFRKPRYLGQRWIFAEVIADSYGEKKQQHTFTLKLIDCQGEDADQVHAVASRNKGTIKRKARNVYCNTTYRTPWINEEERQAVLEEKYKRGAVARAERAVRKELRWLAV